MRKGLPAHVVVHDLQLELQVGNLGLLGLTVAVWRLGLGVQALHMVVQVLSLCIDVALEVPLVQGDKIPPSCLQVSLRRELLLTAALRRRPATAAVKQCRRVQQHAGGCRVDTPILTTLCQ